MKTDLAVPSVREPVLFLTGGGALGFRCPADSKGGSKIAIRVGHTAPLSAIGSEVASTPTPLGQRVEPRPALPARVVRASEARKSKGR